MAAVDQIPLLRLYVDEPSQDDFSDEDLQDILERFTAGDLTDVFLSAASVWDMKAGKFSGLVDVTEGGASRKMSQAFDHALEMSAYYRGRSAAAGEPAINAGITTTNAIERI